ncbi:NUDIX hydrolase [Gaiella sp.]|uniref:NUDIX hydrolase n=1 Tax=Gaiella sp. TaxID=2663207 RepID=UPI002E3191CB|nr:NUDIX domain-containing protein [Gaiella sp.]HEX5582710.1 NUDIX domain-containing protein [Gaiella sp.]
MSAERTVQVRHDLHWLPAGSTARLVVADELPPPELVTAVHLLAFDRDSLLMVDVRADGRGWNPPGGHREADESPEEAATREAQEEACAIIGDLSPFGFQHIRRSNQAVDGPYPHPDSYQVFLLGRVLRLDPFVETDEVSARALLEPSEARQVRWVREHLPLYEEALARTRRRS